MKKYKSTRRIIQFLVTLLIIVLPFFNVVRFDIPNLRFYFFNSILWIDEIYLLFLVMILFVFFILLFTLVYGRLWCGWACPQTTMSDLARWFNTRTKKAFGIAKGDATQFRRAFYWIITLFEYSLISLFVSINIIIYFIDPFRLFKDIASWSQGPVVTVIIIAMAVLFLFNLLFLREAFCTKACPYGLLQVLIIDSKTQVIKYDASRSSDCIKCNACVKSCIMKTDIRETSAQAECIYCGDCIDACEAVLARRNLPALISFSRENIGPSGSVLKKLGLTDAKRFILFLIVMILTAGLAVSLRLRSPLSINVTQDRYTLVRKGEGDRYYNDYQLRISNRDMTDGVFKLKCITSVQDGDYRIHLNNDTLPLKSGEARTINFALSSDGRGLKPGPNMLEIMAYNRDSNNIFTKTGIVFFMPEN